MIPQHSLRNLSVCVAIAVTHGCGSSSDSQDKTAADSSERFSIRVESARISPTKLTGENWDGDDSAPDPQWQIWSQDARIFESVVATDTFEPKYDEKAISPKEIVRTNNVKATIQQAVVAKNAVVEIRFVDKDLLENDPIDTVQHTVNQAGTFPLVGRNSQAEAIIVTIARE